MLCNFCGKPSDFPEMCPECSTTLVESAVASAIGVNVKSVFDDALFGFAKSLFNGSDVRESTLSALSHGLRTLKAKKCPGCRGLSTTKVCLECDTDLESVPVLTLDEIAKELGYVWDTAR